MEKLWSYLRRFNRMTKEMRPAHRTDILTHALLYYGLQKKKDLGKFIIVNKCAQQQLSYIYIYIYIVIIVFCLTLCNIYILYSCFARAAMEKSKRYQ